MNTWKNLALLQPIDGKWCPLDFKIWRTCMLITNAGMVLTEMPAWAFVASVIFGGGTLGAIVGCFVGLIMGVVIWVADAGIATADVQSTRSFSLAAGTRLVFLIISVAFTARYIATFVLAADIQNEWNKRNTTLIQQKRAELFNQKIDTLNKQITEKRRDLDLEVEGRRNRGIIGCGPICRQLKTDLVELNGQLDKVKGDENEFDHLAGNREANAAAFAAKYGLVLPPLTMKARNEILAELTKQPGYRATELTVRGWVFLIFIAMILAKLAQPESAKLVYKQSLRPEIAKYESGEYDPRLLPQYRSTAVPWFMTLSYLLDRVNYFRANEIEQKKLDLINGVNGQLQLARNDVACAEKQVDQARRAFSESQNRRNAVQAEITGSERSLAEIEMARRSLEQNAFSPQRVHEMVELAKFEQAAFHQRDVLRREFETVAADTTRREVALHAKEQSLAALKERMWLAENQLQAMHWSVAKAAATEFARLVAGDAAPAAFGQSKATVAVSEPQQPLRSLADSSKAVIAGLLDGRIAGVPAPASLLRRTISAYLHSKLVAICAIVAFVGAVLIATSLFAHSVLAQLH